MGDKRVMLRHFLAALAYRTQKALRGAPDNFGDLKLVEGLRTPSELVRHMASVLGYAKTFYLGGSYRPEPLPTLDDEVARFHQMLEDHKKLIDDGMPLLDDITPEKLLQGPFADAMTHAGQLAMLRRFAGSPVASENFVMANINAENLSKDQPEPVAPDIYWPGKPPHEV